MAFTDKSLQCADCSKPFTFSADEQEFFSKKGYTNEPERWPACRGARRGQRSGGPSRGGSRQMYSAVCAECGTETQGPFEPREGSPVYCSRCYDKNRPSRGR